MKTLLLDLSEKLRNSFWFVPTMMSVGAVILAFLTVWIDGEIGEFEVLWPASWLVADDLESLRTMLSAVVGAIITVVGLVFSITIVTLTLAANQFGSRLIRNFVRDPSNQFVIGAFSANFLYSILILYATSRFAEMGMVPRISALFSLMLTVASLGVLIFFIHHMAMSIQAENVIDSVYADLSKQIDEFLPDSKDKHRDEQVELPKWVDSVDAKVSHYLQTIDLKGLIEKARQLDMVIKCEHKPGDFVMADEPIALVSRKIDDKEKSGIRHRFYFGIQRTGAQDPEFAISQMVEVAVRALSPSTNDPFTAMNCLDRLGAALAKLAGRELPGRNKYDADDNLRVIIGQSDFRGLCDSAFDQIRHNGKNTPAVMIKLIKTINKIAEKVEIEELKHALFAHALMAYHCGDNFDQATDRNDLQQRFDQTRALLKIEGDFG